VVPRWNLLKHWDDDLSGLSENQLQERLALARRYEASSEKPETGRNPKGAREWRARRQAVEAEIERRRDHP
jgi:hypothetical protein